MPFSRNTLFFEEMKHVQKTFFFCLKTSRVLCKLAPLNNHDDGYNHPVLCYPRPRSIFVYCTCLWEVLKLHEFIKTFLKKNFRFPPMALLRNLCRRSYYLFWIIGLLEAYFELGSLWTVSLDFCRLIWDLTGFTCYYTFLIEQQMLNASNDENLREKITQA